MNHIQCRGCFHPGTRQLRPRVNREREKERKREKEREGGGDRLADKQTDRQMRAPSCAPSP